MRRFQKKRHITPEEFMQRALRARSAIRGLEHFFDRGVTRRPNKPATGTETPKRETQPFSPRRNSWRSRLTVRFITYFYKMRGKNPVTAAFSWKDTAWSFGGAFLGMLMLALVNIEAWGRHEQGLLLGSFGASAMLVFGAPHAPFAQPRNVTGGHVVSALAGVFVQQTLGWEPWLAPWFGRFSDGQLRRGKTLALILLTAAALLAILPFQLPIEIWLAAVIGMQVTATALSTIGDAAAADVAATQFRTTVMTLYVMATDVGAALGPFLGYLMAQWWGVGSMYWSAAALLAGLAIWWLAEKPRGSSIA